MVVFVSKISCASKSEYRVGKVGSGVTASLPLAASLATRVLPQARRKLRG
jgi:hypothetical protein